MLTGRQRLIFTLVIGLLLTACGGAPEAAPAITAAASASPTAAGGPGGTECRLLTAADIAAITGAAVKAVARGAFAGAGGTCGNYATADGGAYLGVNRLASPAEYAASVAAVPTDVYLLKESLAGLGDEAVLFKDRADRPTVRYLVARKGNGGVAVFPLTGAITDEHLRLLAAKALAGL